MTEAQEIAGRLASKYRRYLAGSPPTMTNARVFIMQTYESMGGWRAHISYQMLDNMTEALVKLA